MNAPVDFLISQLGMMLVVSTLILGVGQLFIAAAKDPVHRQRFGELTISAVLCWCVLATIPLPRVDVSHFSADSAAALERELTGVDHHGPRRATVDAPRDHDRSIVPVGISDSIAPTTLESIEPPLAVGQSRSHEVTQTLWPRHIVARIYLAGAAVCCSWLLLGQVVLLWTRSTAQNPPEWIANMFQSLPVPGDRTRGRLLVSARCRRPVSFGLRCPTIIVPRDLARSDHSRILRHVLLHELAHVGRRDAWGHTVLNVAYPALYFHPLYWLIRWNVRFASELIADDWAAGRGSKQSYVEDLVQLARGTKWSLADSLGVLGVFRFRHPFSWRMKMLIEREQPLSVKPSRKWAWTTATVTLAVVITLACLVGVRKVAADNDGSARAENTSATGSISEYGESVEDVTSSTSPTASAAQESPSPGRPLDVVLDEVSSSPNRGANSNNLIRIDRCAISSVNDANVPAHVEGTIVELSLRAGMDVKKGTVLARLGNEQVPLRAERAKIDYEAARQQAQSNIEVRDQEKAVEAAKLNYDAAVLARGTGSPEISEWELSRRKLEWDRSQIALERSTRDMRVAKLNADSQALRLEETNKLLDLQQISAPFDGIVALVFKQNGEWVDAGTAVCRIVGMDGLRVQGFVSATDFNQEDLLGKDVSVEIQLARSQKAQFSAKIMFVSPVIEDSGQFVVSAEFDNRKTPEGFWIARPGMPATMTLATATVPSAPVTTQGASDSNNVDRDEIAFLEELVTISTRTYQRVKALYDAGAPGGQVENEAATRLQMCMAKARLALAKQDWKECREQYEAAVKAADMEVDAYEAAFDAGTVTLDVFLAAQRRRAEAKLELHRITNRILTD